MIAANQSDVALILGTTLKVSCCGTPRRDLTPSPLSPQVSSFANLATAADTLLIVNMGDFDGKARSKAEAVPEDGKVGGVVLDRAADPVMTGLMALLGLDIPAAPGVAGGTMNHPVFLTEDEAAGRAPPPDLVAIARGGRPAHKGKGGR